MTPALLLGEINGWCHWFGSANGVPCSWITRDLDLVLYVRPVHAGQRYGAELVDQHGQQRAINLVPSPAARWTP
ncbi:hypothetical protein [Amycolatopsis thermoflava]|uniref:hypothetical protein n=1 Tax=Amycolatopsis thermoflava TaxID=84480 RepID=UPI003F4A274A